MIQYQLKLKLTNQQETQLNKWLWHLTGIYNWAVRKIKLDAKDKIYHTSFDFQNFLSGHSKKLDIPSHVIQSILSQVHLAWSRCFKKLAKKPHLKGGRNKLNSIPFSDPIKSPKQNRINLPLLGSLKFHKQSLPQGKIKCARICKRASGWYLCLFIDATPNIIKLVGEAKVGIDPGFMSLLTLSNGEKIEHPKELQKGALRLAQAQRGKNKKLTARLHERMANKRKDRNHKLSRRLVSENSEIYFSKDNLVGLSKQFGKSVAASSHAQLRQMLAYKSSHCGRRFVEVNSKDSTKTCSNCGALTGPTGFAGLSVRSWTCTLCATIHDRDINAAINTLKIGAGIALEMAEKPVRNPWQINTEEVQNYLNPYALNEVSHG